MRAFRVERFTKVSRFGLWYGLISTAAGVALVAILIQRLADAWSVSDPSTSQNVPPLNLKAWHYVPELPTDLAQFETVFWEPADTSSLRDWLRKSGRLRGARVLEIGTGTGLIALLCRNLGAQCVVATDINPAAVACGRYNADRLGLDMLEFRQVAARQPGAFAVIEPNERFDLIISNPPWEDAPVNELAAYALYDPGFRLLDDLLAKAGQHLQPEGSLLLAYGAKTALLRIQSRAAALGWKVSVLDERSLDDLPEVFLPGMLLELTR